MVVRKISDDMNLKIGVIGCLGKTGSIVVKLLFQNGYGISAGVISQLDKHENSHTFDIGSGSGVITGINVSEDIDDLFCHSDIVIDFSSPKGLENALNANIKYKKALVSGTTNHELDALLKEAGDVSRVFWSPNMSVILNLISKTANNLAEKLSDKYSIDVFESHHAQKKDIPSGTAKMILNSLVNNPLVYQNEWKFYSDSMNNVEKEDRTVYFSGTRIGGEIGTHSITFADKNEQISITHRSFCRDLFAEGAIQCALWLFKKDVGLYSMKDYIHERYER